jgi:8-oxo-dGTP diphosphatase
VYEAVWDTTPDPRNFSRKVTSTPGFLLPTGEKVSSGRGRPGQLFRRGPATALHPPMLREAAPAPDPGERAPVQVMAEPAHVDRGTADPAQIFGT